MKNLRQNYLLYIIFIVAIFFRFYNYPNRYGFDYDAVRDSLLIHYAIRDISIPLIGPPSSVHGIFFGPWYYYILEIAAIAFPTLYAPWIAIGLLSIAEIYVLYKIGTELVSKWLGYIIAAVVAVSASQITIATGLSNPDIVPFFSSLTILFFILFLKKAERTSYFFILFGFSLGVGIVSHYQMVGYIFFPIIAFLYHRKKWVLHILLVVIGFLIALLPLLIFNIFTHNSYFSSVFSYTLHGDRSIAYVPNSWKIYLLSFWPGFWASTLGLPLIIGIIGLVITFLVFGTQLIRKKLPVAINLILIVFLLNFIYFRFFHGERAVYYTYYLQPFLFIFFGFALYRFATIRQTKGISLLLLLVMFVVMFIESIPLLSSVSSQQAYLQLAKHVQVVYPDKMITFYTCKGIQMERPDSLTFALSELKETGLGIKIGLQNNTGSINCSEVHATKVVTIENEIGTFKIVNLSQSSDRKLYKQGWVPDNEQTIYNSITQWWYPNKYAYAELRINK